MIIAAVTAPIGKMPRRLSAAQVVARTAAAFVFGLGAAAPAQLHIPARTVGLVERPRQTRLTP